MLGSNVKQLNSLALAYIGDAAYELYIRNYLLETGQVRPNELHQKAVSFVSAPAQAIIIHSWLNGDALTEEEQSVVRRGRNAKSNSIPKNASIRDYKYATAFEALIGYHYLMKNEERLDELLTEAVQCIVKGKVD